MLGIAAVGVIPYSIIFQWINSVLAGCGTLIRLRLNVLLVDGVGLRAGEGAAEYSR